MRGRSARDVLTYLRAYAQGPIPATLQRRIVESMSNCPAAGTKPQRQDLLPALDIHLSSQRSLRDYQVAAVDAFITSQGGGIVVLPCGAGKTVVGTAILAKLALPTLILVPNEAAAAQWLAHIRTWTDVAETSVGIDNGRTIKPITITTYQRLTARRRSGEFHHLARYREGAFGLVIYDEVHLLPAKLFRLASQLEAKRKLGLTATLVREDGRAMDVLTLVGPIVFQAHSVDLSKQGHLSPVVCKEIRIPLSDLDRERYARALPKHRHRIAADNERKFNVIRWLCAKHAGERILIMGHYTAFLQAIATRLGVPMLSGSTPHQTRLETYRRFRGGEISMLVLSRIANVAVDLPNANVAIQVSGLFGSRQEEAQRLGRILRPSGDPARFYSLVTANSIEEQHGLHRQKYLIEQGYTYEIVAYEELALN